MLRDLDGLSEEALVRWIEDSLASGRHRLGHGYQGQTLLYQDPDRRLVIKAPSGRGPRRWLSLLMLRHEARVYRQLGDSAAAPRCHGLLRNRYLVLEFIDGELARYATIADREAFFAELFAVLQALHARGIAHSDLQKQDNLFVTRDGHPCLLDFGASVVRKPGFAPFNHLHFRFAARLDLNHWVKLKYRGRMQQVPPSDLRYYRRTRLERMARAFKEAIRWLRVQAGLPRR
jgi:serine/threonine protein kinase